MQYGMRQTATPGDIGFDPQLQISPFALFRALKEGRAPVLVDMRLVPGPLSFLGAVRFQDPAWEPTDETEVVLFDDDGEAVTVLVRELQRRGFPRMRALFGGLRLYDFSLDPAVVGEERFLSGCPEREASS
jgi:hypothetical protein